MTLVGTLENEHSAKLLSGPALQETTVNGVDLCVHAGCDSGSGKPPWTILILAPKCGNRIPSSYRAAQRSHGISVAVRPRTFRYFRRFSGRENEGEGFDDDATGLQWALYAPCTVFKY
ncbi:hypothetical protein MRX96_054701 [Rhipicephalus microplus]